MKITDIRSWLVEIPMLPPVGPYQSRYRASTRTGAIIFRVEVDGSRKTARGIVGWGETPQRIVEGEEFDGGEGPRLLERLRGRDAGDIERLYGDDALDGGYLQSGIEMALWDILGKAAGLPLYRLLGGAVRSRNIELAACMGIQPYERAGEIARLHADSGFSTLKTKAGRDPEEDLAMVRGVRDAVGDRLALRIDPNQGYSPAVALALARDLEPYRLEYLEQPVPKEELAAAAEIRTATRTPVALNESVTTPEAVLDIIRHGAADVLLPDTHQCGGILGVRKVAALAESAGIPCVMHCSHDLGPKTAAMLHIALSTPNFRLANDCTYYGLEDDIITRPFPIESGHMRVPESPGLGIEVSPEKLERYRKR